MNLALLPLLVVALVLMAGEGEAADRAELLLGGRHEVTAQRGALVVGDAEVVVPAGASLPGPLYQIGGELRIEGAVEGPLTQLAGTLVVEEGGALTGELRHFGGREQFAPGADVARRTQMVPADPGPGPVASRLPAVIAALVLAGLGAWASARRRRHLDNVAAALSDHSVVALTVGTLLTLTAVSVAVFMAFTLVLLPVAMAGLVAGVLTIAYGVLGWGHRLGRLLPLPGPWATASGVLVVAAGAQLVGIVPILGDLVTVALALSGVGAVVVTYYGLARFRPDPLPD